MPKILNERLIRKRLGEGVSRIPISVSKQFLEHLDAFRKYFNRVTGVKVTRAYMFREGAMLCMKKLEAQVKLAEKGELHAKRRNRK